MSAFDEVREVVNRSKGLGTRTLPDGTELIGHVPHIAREAYLHLMFKFRACGQMAGNRPPAPE
jgi:hypothetical protein